VLHVDTEILADRQAKLVVTIEPERLQREMQTAARRIATKVNIPGFRKGKAPYHILLRYIGEPALLEEAIDPLGQAVYREALEQSGLEPYAPGALTDMTRDPLTMTFTVPLQPEMDLGNYREVRIPFETSELKDKDVEDALRNVREEQATLEPVERPIQMNDVAVLDIHGDVKAGKKKAEETEEGEETPRLIDRHDVRVLITEESTYPVPGFPDKVIGMEAGQERGFDVKVPKDEDLDEEIRGKTIHFEVVCKEVYRREVPELDDEFAKSVGEFETLDELRNQIREQLETIARQRTENEYLENIFAQIEPAATVTYPPVMLDERIDEMVDNFDRRLRERGLSVEKYLEMNGVEKDQLRDDFRIEAQQSLKRALMLTKLVEMEGLAVEADEIDDEIQTMLLSFGAQASVAKQLFSSPDARRTIANRLITEKATTRLVEIARGTAPEPGAARPEKASDEGDDKPAKKTRAKKAKAEGNVQAAEAKPARARKKAEAFEEAATSIESPPTDESGEAS
jgi:trigger factor